MNVPANGHGARMIREAQILREFMRYKSAPVFGSKRSMSSSYTVTGRSFISCGKLRHLLIDSPTTTRISKIAEDLHADAMMHIVRVN